MLQACALCLRLLTSLCNVGTALMTDPLQDQHLSGRPHADDANRQCSVSTEPHVDLRTPSASRADSWHLQVLCIWKMAVAIVVLCIERRRGKVTYGLTHGYLIRSGSHPRYKSASALLRLLPKGKNHTQRASPVTPYQESAAGSHWGNSTLYSELMEVYQEV